MVTLSILATLRGRLTRPRFADGGDELLEPCERFVPVTRLLPACDELLELRGGERGGTGEHGAVDQQPAPGAVAYVNGDRPRAEHGQGNERRDELDPIREKTKNAATDAEYSTANPASRRTAGSVATVASTPTAAKAAVIPKPGRGSRITQLWRASRY